MTPVGSIPIFEHDYSPLARDVGMDGNPSARKYGNETTPHYVPDRPAVPQVSTTIGVQ